MRTPRCRASNSRCALATAALSEPDTVTLRAESLLPFAVSPSPTPFPSASLSGSVSGTPSPSPTTSSTCTGSLSRNRQVGLAIGEGATLAEVLAGRETVAEGVATTQSAQALAARMGVEMPIVAAVHRVLFERQPARWALVELMTRDLKEEGA